MKKSFIFLTLLMMVMPLWGFTWKAQWIEAQDNRSGEYLAGVPQDGQSQA